MLLLKNKKATFNYEVLETYTAGISLYGFEVKSLKQKHGSFEGSFVSVAKKPLTTNKEELILKNFYIPPFQEKNTPSSYDQYRDRKLLLKRKEIKEIIKKMQNSRLTLIPLSFHTINNLIKIKFALARGKKKFDKRESIKKRDIEKNLKRDLKIQLR